MGSFFTEKEASNAYHEALQDIEKGEIPKRKSRIFTSEFNIKLRRGKLGITLVQLSKLSGVSYPTISFIENGKIKPHAKTLVKLDECLSRLEEECRLGGHPNDLTN